MQIKNIASAREASISDSNDSVSNMRKKKSKTGVLRSTKSPKKAHSHHGIQSYCVLFKKSGIPERKYTSHSAKDFTGVRTNWTIKYGMGGPVVSRTDSVKHYKKSEKKRKKELKAIKKHNKMLYSISKKSGLLREIKNIKKIRAKAYNKGSNSSSDDSDSDSLLSRDSS